MSSTEYFPDEKKNRGAWQPSNGFLSLFFIVLPFFCERLKIIVHGTTCCGPPRVLGTYIVQVPVG